MVTLMLFSSICGTLEGLFGLVAFVSICYLSWTVVPVLKCFKRDDDKTKRIPTKIVAIVAIGSIVGSFLFDFLQDTFRKGELEDFAEEAVVLKKEYDHTIQFEKNKSGLNAASKAKLDDLALKIKKLEKKYDLRVSVKVVGHTSSEGDETLNQKLSEDRAKTCSDYLEDMEAGHGHTYAGKGSKEPLDDNNLEVNRRIEFFFTKW